MADRRQHDLEACARVVLARRAMAQSRFAQVAAEDAHAHRTAVDANARRDAEVAVWQAHIATAFDPAMETRLAADLVCAAMHADEAAAACGETRRVREDAAWAWRTEDARCRAARAALDRSARSMARQRDERACAAAADRTTLQWTTR